MKEKAKTTTLITRCGERKRQAKEVIGGGCEKRSKNDHSNLLPDEVTLGKKEGHEPNLQPEEVILAKTTTLTKCGSLKREATEVILFPEEDHEPNLLPDEIIFDNIMTRVPSKTLMSCSCVSKVWYRSILHDPHFTTAYFAQQSKKDPPFIFYNFNVPFILPKDGKDIKFPNRSYIFRFEVDEVSKRKTRNEVDSGLDSLLFDERFVLESSKSVRIELVGICNGLVCLVRNSNSIIIVNPSRRKERLIIYYPPSNLIIGHRGKYIVCCYGFGLDSFTHEYKVVLIVVVNNKSEFKCLVFTLGTNSWRETSTTIPLPVKTTSFYKSAIFCSGALFWRTKPSSSPSSDNDMLLLSFDLHDYKFQVIRIPAECASSSLLEERYQIIDPLLEFKGSPCVARLEKTISEEEEEIGTSTSTSDDQNISYCYKVHLHILMEYNKVGRPNEQVWIKETFDVAPVYNKPLMSPSAPCFISNIATTSTLGEPPTRIMSSSDGRVFLYNFLVGQVIQAYDLQTKRLNVANCGKYARFFFNKKHSKVYDQIDYHLSGGHIENFMSMMAFIPKGGGEGAPPRLDRDELRRILGDKQRTPPLVGYLSVIHQKSADHHYLL